MKMIKLFAGVISGSVLALATTTSVLAANKPTLEWAGCGITKKAFMEELAKAYEKKSGIKINLNGGGAT